MRLAAEQAALAKKKEREIFDAQPQQTTSTGNSGSMLPSLGGGGLPQMGAPRSTGLALFDEIEI